MAAGLGTSRPNLSDHLARLRGCGLVAAAPEGRGTRYELADARPAHALGDLLGPVLSAARRRARARVGVRGRGEGSRRFRRGRGSATSGGGRGEVLRFRGA
ncbi:hypothetical protein GCM10009539_35640 [Cryptosporangium japonicum]|uniref:HTH arsR-type domain-containing protein n=1 Tax=Cryptosporangium japonicum TaxID=80872 RepID=A0ABN0UDT2_9ACTN